MPYKFENAALFLRSGLLLTLIHYKTAFLKTLFKAGKHFAKRRRHDNHVIFPTEFSSTTNPKIASDCHVIKFLWCKVDGKHLMRLPSETFIFKFPDTLWVEPNTGKNKGLVAG